MFTKIIVFHIYSYMELDGYNLAKHDTTCPVKISTAKVEMVTRRILVFCLALIATLYMNLVSSAFASAQSASALTPLANNISPLIDNGFLAVVGKAEANLPITLVIGLQLPNPNALNSSVTAIRAGHARPLTPQQFTDRYAPTSGEYASVVSFLEGNGFSVETSPDRLTITATGTVAQAEKAFGVQINTYVKNGKTYYANATAPRIPAYLSTTIESVAGLDDLPVFHVLSRMERPAENPNSRVSATYYGVDGFTPLGIRTAYDVAPVYKQVSGTGQGIDIVIWDSLQQRDVDTFDRSYGLAPATVNQIPVGGKAAPLDYSNGSIEATIDAEWSHAIAPKATINVFEATSNRVALLERAIQRAIRRHDANVLSMSWSAPEDGLSRAQIRTMNNLFAEGAAEGMTILAASGDNGAFADGSPPAIPEFPASDPYVTAVGGTTLTVNANGTYADETAWIGSGGGFSHLFPAPEWQQPTVDNYTYGGYDYNLSGMRGVPDLALNSGAGTAAFVDGSWGEGLGTSFAAPSWAGLVALLNQGLESPGRQPLGDFDPGLADIGTSSSYTSVFHQVYSGDNYALGGGVGPYYASRGWNPVTGWGTPDFARLLHYLVNDNSTSGNH